MLYYINLLVLVMDIISANSVGRKLKISILEFLKLGKNSNIQIRSRIKISHS